MNGISELKKDDDFRSGSGELAFDLLRAGD